MSEPSPNADLGGRYDSVPLEPRFCWGARERWIIGTATRAGLLWRSSSAKWRLLNCDRVSYTGWVEMDAIQCSQADCSQSDSSSRED